MNYDQWKTTDPAEFRDDAIEVAREEEAEYEEYLDNWFASEIEEGRP